MSVWRIPEEKRKNKIGYKVKINQVCDYYDSAEEEFGEWSASYTNTFESIRRRKNDEEYPDVVSDLDIQPGEDLYVVWVEYSSGDSFGNSQNSGVEVVALFKDYSAAVELRDRLEPIRYPDYYDYTKMNLDYIAKDGQHIFVYYGTWSGYFENLETIHIDKTWMQ